MQYAESSSAPVRCKLCLTVPDRTPCVHCGKTGFVRREYVIQAGKAMTAFYCGACDRSWHVGDEETSNRIRPDQDQKRQESQ
jgi:hypothetical protein